MQTRGAGRRRRPSRDITVAAETKRTSVLRRLPPLGATRCVPLSGYEGDVCAFQLAQEDARIVVEAVTGRAMTLAPGDIFLGTPGFRESTRWVVGGVPQGGLVIGGSYWVLSESGVVGDLVGESPLEKGHLGRVTYLGAVPDASGRAMNIRSFAAEPPPPGADQGAAVFLVLGTSAEVGKSTAASAILRALRRRDQDVVALKATGTSAINEISTYRDFGAMAAFDCVDFGLPTTYPSDRDDIEQVFARAIDTCLSLPAAAVLIECGGDLFGANVPQFLDCLKARRPDPKIILAAADALGALGAQAVLGEKDLHVHLVTGPCTDTPTLRERTGRLCGVPALNFARGNSDSLVL
jgi:hypothetical protein